MPGDIIIADESGVVCVPKEDIVSVAAGVEAKLKKEEKSYAEIEAGQLVKGDIDKILAGKLG